MATEEKPAVDKSAIDAFINEESAEHVDDVVRKYEAESRFRKFSGNIGKLVAFICIAMSLFHLYTAGFGVLEAIKQRNIHLTFCLVLSFLLYPSGPKGSSNRTTLWDWILVSLSVTVGVYLMVIYDDLANRGGVTVPMDIYMGGLLCLLVLEAARRATGKELPIMALCFVAYALFGDLIPGQVDADAGAVLCPSSTVSDIHASPLSVPTICCTVLATARP